MKIERTVYSPHTGSPGKMTLEQFADMHGLVMEITDYTAREPFEHAPHIRYHASFKGVETKDTSTSQILTRTWGGGLTEDEAMDAYRKALSGRWMVVNAAGKDRREFQVPVLTTVR